ncbi:formate dehydrogenase subunit alpha [Effusibacillus lacus]|uniref:Formate dehydrogenase subunit alpha n=1 Tax=Effusibacillus lacus TaxID=1348429 RepID=A0A292YRX1_9BACL|nr:formate dehydrogenase subunit alpha [Effusibacillus lacus]TCS76894.1 assimilatory nitrate reductase catalytic subunit [Effusibacillus lacus]GAX91225.1 formate dehydrogenase subunit alpha [Effusibacillus lacus]
MPHPQNADYSQRTYAAIEREGEVLIPTHCCFCGMQCGMNIRVDKDSNQVLGVEPRYDFPMNGGRLCPKGVAAYRQAIHPERLLRPLIRKNGQLVESAWDEAMDLIVSKIRDIQGKYGKDAFGIYSGSSMTNEKCYLVGKFARIGLGTKHIDYNGRYCMSSAAAGFNQTLGIDRGGTNPWSDIKFADVLLIAGSNTAECHPLSMPYVWGARDNGAKLIVVDPRQTKTALVADIHLNLKPGTDLALVNGLIHVLIKEDMINHEFVKNHTSGFEDLKAMAEKYPPEVAARITGLPKERIVEAARIFGQAKNGMVLFARGVEQHAKGSDSVSNYTNLCLITGKIGRKGSGVATFTGQGNGQGGREHGQKADQLPGYRKITDPEARKYIAGVWGVDESEIPGPGISAFELLKALGKEVKGLLLICSNPMVSAPSLGDVKQYLTSLEFFVCMDFFLSESAELADVVLPSTVWIEDNGTTTNVEGRVIRINGIDKTPGEARRDWEVLCELADRLGRGQFFRYNSPQEIFDELRVASRGGIADYFGITYEKIEKMDGVFWPCPSVEHEGTPRLFEDRKFNFPDGKARLLAFEHKGPNEDVDQEYPLLLTTGRVVYHYLSGNQTRRIDSLRDKCPDPYVEIHPETAKRYGIENGHYVKISSRRGYIVVPAKITKITRPDMVFVPYHWGKTLAINNLTNPALDPKSKIPEFKVCAVKIEPTKQQEVRHG